MIQAAYLRIYLPADRTVRLPDHVAPRRRTVIAASDHFVWGEPATDDAFRIHVDGVTYLCPRSPRLRMLEGVLAFSNAYPTSGLLPERTVRHAAAELEQLRNDSPTLRSHILTSPWHVPLRWFIPFSPDQREIYEGPHGTSIRYRTGLGSGRTRVHHAVETLDDAGFDASVIDQVSDLARWLDEFTSEGLLELDYDAVASLFSQAELAFDDSAEEVNASLEALAELDYEAAGRHYAEVASRWAIAQAVTYAN
ncbi:MAG: hypothetical protein QNJ88_16040 [Acidimicrobiia bacterium]|nr:hypothetical protein [Acidimicrobiia bacterium]